MSSRCGTWMEVNFRVTKELTWPEFVHDLLGHTDWIRGLRIWNDKLLSCSLDTTVKIWDIQAQQLLLSLECKAPLYSMDMFTCDTGQNFLVVGCSTSLKIWNLANFCLVNTLSGHSDYICCAKIVSGFIISGSFDGAIKLWQTPQEANVLEVNSNN